MKRTPKVRIKKTPTRLFVTLTTVLGIVALTALSSCNVTRKVTTESSFFQRGDTTCTIVTKTTETYDASKKL